MSGKAVVAMEGVLKKRGANVPVMRDRYCVALLDARAPHLRHEVVLLRSYKTHDAYVKWPSKPVGEHEVKCISEWDGKGKLHRYPHAFVIETQANKLFHCSAPTRDEKKRWMELMRQVDQPRGALDEQTNGGGGAQQKRDDLSSMNGSTEEFSNGDQSVGRYTEPPDADDEDDDDADEDDDDEEE